MDNQQAEQAGKLVASLRWLKDTLKLKEVRSSKLKALHYVSDSSYSCITAV
jgi:hypothetical protein